MYPANHVRCLISSKSNISESISNPARWLQKMRQISTWGDTAMLHCLGCAFGVDLCVLIHGQPSPALVGPSCTGVENCEILASSCFRCM